jgi:hypothetical protein
MSAFWKDLTLAHRLCAVTGARCPVSSVPAPPVDELANAYLDRGDRRHRTESAMLPVSR